MTEAEKHDQFLKDFFFENNKDGAANETLKYESSHRQAFKQVDSDQPQIKNTHSNHRDKVKAYKELLRDEKKYVQNKIREKNEKFMVITKN